METAIVYGYGYIDNANGCNCDTAPKSFIKKYFQKKKMDQIIANR
jgi:hypothetical protein